MNIEWQHLKSPDHTPRFNEVARWLQGKESAKTALVLRQWTPLRLAWAGGAALLLVICLWPVTRSVTLGYIMECSVAQTAAQSEALMQTVCGYDPNNAKVCESIGGPRTISKYQVAFLDIADASVSNCLASLHNQPDVISVEITPVEKLQRLPFLAALLDKLLPIYTGGPAEDARERQNELRIKMRTKQCV